MQIGPALDLPLVPSAPKTIIHFCSKEVSRAPLSDQWIVGFQLCHNSLEELILRDFVVLVQALDHNLPVEASTRGPTRVIVCPNETINGCLLVQLQNHSTSNLQLIVRCVSPNSRDNEEKFIDLGKIELNLEAQDRKSVV